MKKQLTAFSKIINNVKILNLMKYKYKTIMILDIKMLTIINKQIINK
jgi:hypothetical protein